MLQRPTGCPTDGTLELKALTFSFALFAVAQRDLCEAAPRARPVITLAPPQMYPTADHTQTQIATPQARRRA